MIHRYEGVCAVCGGDVSTEHDQSSGVIDFAVEDDVVYTWIRHVDGPEPDCKRYFSRVYRTATLEGPSQYPPYSLYASDWYDVEVLSLSDSRGWPTWVKDPFS